MIFELGWFYANLGRSRVCILDQASEQIQIFSDLQGDCMGINEINKGNMLIYERADGSSHIDVHIEGETLWLTQAQMGELFGVQKAAISKHLANIFESGELYSR